MKKKNSIVLILTTLGTLIPIILGIILYDKLPEQIPSHFNMAGEVDGYMAKNIMIFGMPLGLATLNVFVNFSLEADPKKQNANKTIKLIGKCIIPITSCMFFPISLLYAMGYEVPVHIIVPCFVGILFVVMGNYLPKSKQSYTVGIKLPWTLANENNWNKTHRLAGILFVISGIVIIGSTLMNFGSYYVLLGTVVVCTGIPFVYSYSLYKKGN